MRQHNSWWKQIVEEAAADSKDILVETPQGSETAMLLPLREPFKSNVQTSITRIAKGILFKHHPAFDTTNLEFEAQMVQEQGALKFAKDWKSEVGRLNYQTRVGGNVFQAQWGTVIEDPNKGMMLMAFFGGLAFLVFFGPPGFTEEAKRKAAELDN